MNDTSKVFDLNYKSLHHLKLYVARLDCYSKQFQICTHHDVCQTRMPDRLRAVERVGGGSEHWT